MAHHEPIETCPAGYHWSPSANGCVPNVSPAPSPPKPTPSPRLGNPSISELLQFSYGETPTPSTAQTTPEPMPPIPGGEDTLLTLTSDKTYYQWGQAATLKAILLYKKDGAPVTGRPAVLYVNQVSYVAFTDSTGTATFSYTPFAVPPPNYGSVVFSAYAEFRGY